MTYNLMPAFLSGRHIKTSKVELGSTLPLDVLNRALDIASELHADVIVTNEEGRTWIV